MPEIKTQDLDRILAANRNIHEEVSKFVRAYLEKEHPRGWNRVDGAKKWIKVNGIMVEAPINDPSLGGFVFFRGENKKNICFINTNQPRVYQNFVLFHELYHFLTLGRQTRTVSVQGGRVHFLKADIDIENEERRADYFASLMLLPEDEVKEFYRSLASETKDDAIYYTMYHFQAPYKAVLIRLYELRLIDLRDLVERFEENSDFHAVFQRMGLDTASVEMSKTIDLQSVRTLMLQNRFMLPEFTNKENEKALERIETEIHNLREKSHDY
ncbi:ImmA/IrrE family metallo-endopeptidase [Bacillaceae bacterium Marseille-Q3522]|nr:ImmA/IrrE family metallo-endopeptidase [Bacillaceae bacterium Marseille-Q3522]